MGVQVAVVDVEFHAKRFQAHEVHVDFAGTDLAATRHGNARLPEARDKRPEHADAGAHLRHQLVRRFARLHRRGVDGHGVIGALNGCAKALEHFGHDDDVADIRHVVQRGFPLAQNGRGNKLQRRVFRAGNLNFSSKGVVAFDNDDFFLSHGTSPLCVNDCESPL